MKNRVKLSASLFLLTAILSLHLYSCSQSSAPSAPQDARLPFTDVYLLTDTGERLRPNEEGNIDLALGEIEHGALYYTYIGANGDERIARQEIDFPKSNPVDLSDRVVLTMQDLLKNFALTRTGDAKNVLWPGEMATGRAVLLGD